MFRRKNFVLLSSLSLVFTFGSPVFGQCDLTQLDAETEATALEFVNGANSPEELVLLADTEPGRATALLAIRDGVYGGAFPSYQELEATMVALDPTLECCCKIIRCVAPTSKGEWNTLPYTMQHPSGAAYSAAHSSMLRTGRVIFFPEGDILQTLLWDPTNEVSPIFDYPDNQPTDFLFCSGHQFLSDGRLLAVGGGGNFVSNAIDRAWKFDPVAGTDGTWTQTSGNMSFKRWYPTPVSIGYPKMLVASGIHGPGVVQVPEMEIYNEITDSFTIVTGPPGNPGGADRIFPETYPNFHVLPTGQIVYTRTGFGHFTGETGPNAAFFEWTTPTNPTTGEWTETSAMNFADRTEGMSVQLLTPDPGPNEYTARVVVFGGGAPDTSGRQKVESIDGSALTAATPWVLLPDMAAPRFHVTTVLLPTGVVIVFGGDNHGNSGTTGNKITEIFHPNTNTFTTAGDMEFSRGYHTVSVLLPSGKIMASGGISGANERKIEIFSPSYLFQGPRPKIDTTPPLVHHGGTFTIVSPEASTIAKIVLVPPMSYTHHLASAQRVLELEFTQSGTTLTAIAPDGIHPHPQAPRAYYMLFIINKCGVPSVAEFIQLH